MPNCIAPPVDYIRRLPRVLECRSDASRPSQSAHAPCPTFTRFTHVLAWLTTKTKREVSMTISVCDGRLIKMTVATALLATVAQPGFGQDLKYKPIAVKTPDGLTISAQEWGNAAGAEILFIHGFSQSHLSWMRQVDSDLAKEFRIVTYDLRGHGNSDKPLEAARYRDSKAWGDEVQAVIDAAGLKHPVLVGWSYAGRVISDYLATHGSGQLAGINFVDAPIKADPALIGDNLKNLPLMASDDLVTNITATRTFLHGCFSKQPSADDYETMLAFNMMVLPRRTATPSSAPANIPPRSSRAPSSRSMRGSVTPRSTKTPPASTPNSPPSCAPPPRRIEDELTARR